MPQSRNKRSEADNLTTGYLGCIAIGSGFMSAGLGMLLGWGGVCIGIGGFFLSMAVTIWKAGDRK